MQVLANVEHNWSIFDFDLAALVWGYILIFPVTSTLAFGLASACCHN